VKLQSTGAGLEADLNAQCAEKLHVMHIPPFLSKYVPVTVAEAAPQQTQQQPPAAAEDEELKLGDTTATSATANAGGDMGSSASMS